MLSEACCSYVVHQDSVFIFLIVRPQDYPCFSVCVETSAPQWRVPEPLGPQPPLSRVIFECIKDLVHPTKCPCPSRVALKFLVLRKGDIWTQVHLGHSPMLPYRPFAPLRHRRLWGRVMTGKGDIQ